MPDRSPKRWRRSLPSRHSVLMGYILYSDSCQQLSLLMAKFVFENLGHVEKFPVCMYTF